MRDLSVVLFFIKEVIGMLVSATEMVTQAKKGKYAVGQFNIDNLEWTKAILETAQEQKSPVILGVGPRAAKFMGGYKTTVLMTAGLIEDLKITVPVALHLDHGSFEAAKECIRVGFSSIMYDGSKSPFEENVVNTRNLAFACSLFNISLEAEVGSIGGSEEGITGKGEFADPEECRIIAETGITMLAAGIGNIHGKYPPDWSGLNFDCLEQVREKTGPDMPLVLHGGTGIPDSMIKKAIELGVAKINVNTECMLAFQKELHDYILAGKDEKGFTPFEMFASGLEAIKQTVRNKMALFGSVNKA